MSARPIFIGNIRNCFAQILNADGVALVTLLTPGASGTRLKSLVCTSDDTSDRVVQLWVTRSGVDYLLGECTIVDGAGSNAVAGSATVPDKGYEVLNLTDFPFLQTDNVNHFIDLEAGAVLKVKVKTQVTASKKLQFFGECGDI